MNVLHLRERNDPPDAPDRALACGVCGTIHGKPDPTGYAFQAAEKCCSTVCSKRGGEKEPKGYCNACQRERDRKEEALNYEKAGKIPAAEHNGPVYRSDDFYPSVDEYLEHCEQEGFEPDAYVWAVYETHVEIDADAILETALEDHWEEAEAVGVKELNEFIAAWNERQIKEGTVTWQQDTSRVILLNEEGPCTAKSLRKSRHSRSTQMQRKKCSAIRVGPASGPIPTRCLAGTGRT